MPVDFDKKSGLINLHNDHISYIIQILNNRYPIHRYFGRYLSKYHGMPLAKGNHAFSTDITTDFPYSVTSLPLEYSTIGSGDYRQPGYLIKDDYNHLLPILEYTSLSINTQPLNPDQLPTTVAPSSPVTTLVLHLADSVTALKMDLNYTIFEKENLILRSTTLHNAGTTDLTIDSLASAQLDLPDDNYLKLSLSGTHAHEANPQLTPLHSGIQLQHTFRGTSGPQQQPFTALSRQNVTEFNGEVLGCALVWSGNFESSVEVDQYQHTRLTIGLEPTTFDWKLKPDTDFQSPETILTWSDQGFNGMSQNFHHFADQIQPTLQVEPPLAINTWESMFFDVSEKKVNQFVQEAQPLGIKMIVIDDGWFINRHDETGQLGDWKTDPVKFPQGLRPLSDLAHSKHMKFGLWVEPEMITQNSQLFHEHPEWILNYQDRSPITARHQLILDLSQEVVQQHLLNTLTNLVQTNHLDYLKWDMNRHLTQVGNNWLPEDQQGEFYYRYVIGLYHLLKQLKDNCPNLIIENCSAGGGRLDFGMLAFTNQTWLSDLTDPVDRSKIENGFSYLFPHNIFSNHITASPNGQNGRLTPLQSRLNLAIIGQMGFELNLHSLNNNEQDDLKKEIISYKTNYDDFKTANFYRLETWDSGKVAWLLVTKDQRQALCFYSYGLGSAVKTSIDLPLYYLNNNFNYCLESGSEYSGLELNQIGLTIPASNQDFQIKLFWIKQI